MDEREIYRRASEEFTTRVHQIDGRWDAPTPLPGWDVRELVGHLVNEEVWTPPLFAGSSMTDVGDRFDGDLLGADPVGSHVDAAAAALAAVVAPGALDRTVHLSFGDYPGREYAMQLAADHLVHAWDLARAIGADQVLDAEAVAAIAGWFVAMERVYRDMGVIEPRVPTPAGAGTQTTLLAAFGRSAA